jgi:hypothetical protein
MSFQRPFNEHEKKYFQLIAFDLMQLNSDVIRAFKKVYPIGENPDLSEVVNGEVEFYVHCTTASGIKMNLWEKIGKIADVGDTKAILFRNTNDCGTRIDEEPVRISNNWYVWHINDENFTRVGKLVGENRKADIGVVVTPDDIVERLKTGKYDFSYPGFE